MFSTPETSVHVLDKNREISPLGREEGYGGKGSGEKVSFKMRMEDPVRHANHRFRSRVRAWRWRRALADWQGTRRDGRSLFHRWGAAYWKERLVILRLDWMTGSSVDVFSTRSVQSSRQGISCGYTVKLNQVMQNIREVGLTLSEEIYKFVLGTGAAC